MALRQSAMQPEHSIRDWLRPADDDLRKFLALPELALAPESCAAEISLHDSLLATPSRPVTAAELDAVQDDDARANYGMFISFRDALLKAGTLESYYIQLMRSRRITIAPVFVEHLVKAIVLHLLADRDDAFEVRAAELLYRPQRVSLIQDRMLSADLAAVDMLRETAGLGDIGRLLVQSNAPVAALDMPILGVDNAADYWTRRDQYAFVLDMTQEVTTDIGRGLRFTTVRSHSGLKALARVLEKWVLHLLGSRVTITPLRRIDDPAWRWHIGLDADAMALLNDLYEDRTVDAERMQRLLSLFKLEFEDPAEMRADVAGRPVYLGLATMADGSLRLKPQNLLLNLPLATSM